MSTASHAHVRRPWQSPLISAASAAEALTEAEKRQADLFAIKKEHTAAEAGIEQRERDHAAAVKAAVADGLPSPERDTTAEARLADLALRLDAATALKAEAASRAHKALLESAPEMVATMPGQVAEWLAEIDEHGLTAERAEAVEVALSALRFYRELSKAPGTLTWRPCAVEVSAGRGADLVGLHRAAAQAMLSRILNAPRAA